MHEELFCRRLAQLRQQKGVSARDMSLSIGQNAGYINNIENQHNLPSMSVFFYICDYLGVSPREFFDADVTYPKEVKTLIEYSSRLSSDDLSHIIALAEALANKSNKS